MNPPIKFMWSWISTQREKTMLKIVFGDIENSIYHPPVYFDNTYEDEWMTDPWTIEMIKDIDQSEVLSARAIDSPFLGSISTKEISGGAKTLILMKFDDSGKIFNASACGDNCAKWIVDIAKNKELTIDLHHIMDFSGCGDFEAFIVNTGKRTMGYDQYLEEAFRIKER